MKLVVKAILATGEKKIKHKIHNVQDLPLRQIQTGNAQCGLPGKFT